MRRQRHQQDQHDGTIIASRVNKDEHDKIRLPLNIELFELTDFNRLPRLDFCARAAPAKGAVLRRNAQQKSQPARLRPIIAANPPEPSVFQPDGIIADDRQALRALQLLTTM